MRFFIIKKRTAKVWRSDFTGTNPYATLTSPIIAVRYPRYNFILFHTPTQEGSYGNHAQYE